MCNHQFLTDFIHWWAPTTKATFQQGRFVSNSTRVANPNRLLHNFGRKDHISKSNHVHVHPKSVFRVETLHACLMAEVFSHRSNGSQMVASTLQIKGGLVWSTVLVCRCHGDEKTAHSDQLLWNLPIQKIFDEESSLPTATCNQQTLDRH